MLEEYVKEKKKNELLVEQEQELRNQLSLYTEKFEEFQKTLTRSVWSRIFSSINIPGNLTNNIIFVIIHCVFVENPLHCPNTPKVYNLYLIRSNDVFATFKQEMNKMSKTIKKLEKENLSWKGKHEQVSKSMFTMAEEVRYYYPSFPLIRFHFILKL